MPDDPLPQLTEEDLKGLSPEQIVAAREAGQLPKFLGVPLPSPPFRPTNEEGKPRAITEADLAQMTPEEIVTGRRAGRLRHLGYAPGGRR
jgi:hypothetical protein